MLINLVIIALGALFLVLAFLATGMRAAFGSDPARPATSVDRYILFVAGLLALGTGFYRLLK